jgi:hypothetical protein
MLNAEKVFVSLFRTQDLWEKRTMPEYMSDNQR